MSFRASPTFPLLSGTARLAIVGRDARETRDEQQNRGLPDRCTILFLGRLEGIPS